MEQHQMGGVTDATAITTTPGSVRHGPMATLRAWPRRRWIAAGAALPVLAGAFLLSDGAGTARPWGSWPAVLLLAGLGSLILASYLPHPNSGQLFEVGCAPCAIVAGGAVFMSIYLRSTGPETLPRTALCAGLLAFGLHQRLVDAQQCSTAGASPPSTAAG